jgi:hypothetical protein
MKLLGWVAILAWAAFLYGGVKITTRSVLLCTAALDFPQNHLLNPGDLTCASFSATKIYEGRYLKRPSARNNVISPDDVSDSPLLRLNPETAMFVLTISNDQAKKLDADQRVDLGANSTAIAKQARIVAILCAGTGLEHCRLALEVPQSELKVLVDVPGQVGIVDSSKNGVPQNVNGAAADQHK